MVAEYRVGEAKKLFKDQPNIKVEEIAEQVGYNSKSSFNTVFKKLTGSTPSEFRSRKELIQSSGSSNFGEFSTFL